MRHTHSIARVLCFAFSLVVGSAGVARAGQQQIDVVVPSQSIRSLLPADGEIAWSHTITRDKWPKNSGDFERNETFEISLGRGIRARQSDRADEPSLSPGVRFEADKITLAGGWRAHLQAKLHPDYFDGTLRVGFSVGGSVGDPKIGIVEVYVDWRESILGEVIKFASFGIVRPEQIAERYLRERMVQFDLGAKLREALQGEVAKLASQHGKTVKQIANAITLSITKDGIRLIGNLESPAQFLDVSVGPAMPDFHVPPRTQGDAEFKGHGPTIEARVQFRVREDRLERRVFFRASETKKNWSESKGWSEWAVAHQDPRIKGATIVGSESFLLASQTLSGHGEHSFRSDFGAILVRGDRKGDDAGVWSGIRVDFNPAKTIQLQLAR
jgi:hypothetical protein